VGKSGYDTEHLYVVPYKTHEEVDVADASDVDADASMDNHALDASIILNSPREN
jgi:hypothetical protein